ncbi:hypothetical protein [Rahnella sp. Larv3_ips]|uniref:hypothetical protein n=1 Tax=Rahnella sp. Larv3_ips TaxID=1896943 RepID=UPI000EFB983D|nr:hypothetical protein [Rahnella sp. Larv3_ips]
MKKINYTFNLKLAFDVKKKYTPPTLEGGGVNVQVDPNKTWGLMTTLVALAPWIGLITIILKLVYLLIMFLS